MVRLGRRPRTRVVPLANAARENDRPTDHGLRSQPISVHSGSSAWTVNTIIDAADRTTISDLQHYVDHTQRDDGNLHGWEMTLLSPTKFTNFVAHRCGGTWVEG